MSLRDPFLEVVALVIALSLVLTPIAGFIEYHSSPTIEGEVVNTRSEMHGDHEIRAWADVKNTDNETGVACVRFVFEEGHEEHTHTECKGDIEPGETVTIHSNIHADGKSVTERDIRRMEVHAYSVEERNPDSIFSLS